MPIKYHIAKKGDPRQSGEGNYKYYPHIYDRERIDTKELANRLSKACSVREPDIRNVLFVLAEELSGMLLDNNIIEIDNLGSFSLEIKAESANTPEEVKKSKIKSVNVTFRTASAFKRKLKLAQFVKGDND